MKIGRLHGFEIKKNCVTENTKGLFRQKNDGYERLAIKKAPMNSSGLFYYLEQGKAYPNILPNIPPILLAAPPPVNEPMIPCKSKLLLLGSFVC